MKNLLATFFISLSILTVSADDWPQWRGPNRNGLSQETGLLKEWPQQGPKLLWRVDIAGAGYSTPSIVGDRIYLLGNEGMDSEFTQALSVQDGKRLWQTRLGKVGANTARMNYAAARSTPTVEGDVLYVLGSDGDLACLEKAGGKLRWQKNLRTEFGGQPGDWAYAESPLIDGDVLICTPGGATATMVGLNKKSGEVIWKWASPEGDLAAFASPILVEFAGVRQCVQLMQKGLVGLESKSGKFLWRYAKPISRFNANIPTPLASDGHIYVASAGTGGGLVKLKRAGNGIEAEQVYFESKLPTTIGGVIKVGDYLYGTTGQAMMCLEFFTGQIKWEERAPAPASMCFADDRLYLHGENGEVALAEPSPDGYRQKGRFTPPGQPQRVYPTEKTWAYPVVANGRLYIREHGTLWCYDVKR